VPPRDTPIPAYKVLKRKYYPVQVAWIYVLDAVKLIRDLRRDRQALWRGGIINVTVSIIYGITVYSTISMQQEFPTTVQFIK
jgi:hypothetical protein